MDATATSPLPKRYTMRGKRVWVAGHKGMVGAALLRRLADKGCQPLTADRRDVDLTRQEAVERWMAEARPHVVFVAAARVGGILANDTYPADFLYDNLLIHATVASGRIGATLMLASALFGCYRLFFQYF